MIFLPLEISVTKYQTSAELLKTLNEFIKCQWDIEKYISCTIKEHSPAYSLENVSLPNIPSSSQAVILYDLLKSKSLLTKAVKLPD